MCKLRNELNFLEEPILYFKSTNNRLVNNIIEKYYNLYQKFPDNLKIFQFLKWLRDKKNFSWTEIKLKNICE